MDKFIFVYNSHDINFNLFNDIPFGLKSTGFCSGGHCSPKTPLNTALVDEKKGLTRPLFYMYCALLSASPCIVTLYSKIPCFIMTC